MKEDRSFKIGILINPVPLKKSIRIKVTARVFNKGRRIKETKEKRRAICHFEEMKKLRPFYNMMSLILEDVIEREMEKVKNEV